jgi:hypothetical protein
MNDVPVVIGFRLTGNDGSTAADGGAQSWVFPVAFTGVHAIPACGDPPAPLVQVASHVPELVTPGVPPRQSGHGKVPLAVR